MNVRDWLRGQIREDHHEQEQGQEQEQMTAEEGAARVAKLAARMNRHRELVTAGAEGPSRVLNVDPPEGHARRLPECPPPLPHWWSPPDVPRILSRGERDAAGRPLPPPQPKPPPEPKPRHRIGIHRARPSAPATHCR